MEIESVNDGENLAWPVLPRSGRLTLAAAVLQTTSSSTPRP
jgi:hypothetical protein